MKSIHQYDQLLEACERMDEFSEQEIKAVAGSSGCPYLQAILQFDSLEISKKSERRHIPGNFETRIE